MVRTLRFVSIGAISAALLPIASAQITITPTFDSSITSDSNAAQIEGCINSAITYYDGLISNNISVDITFSEMNSGLGRSSWYWYSESYSAYRAALVTHATSAVDNTVLAHLPNSASDPVVGSSQIALNGNLANALGFNVGTDQDGIGLNTALCFYNHNQPVAGKYDL